METIGEAITTKAKEFIRLYQSISADDNLRGIAKGLATHDLAMTIYINEEALKLLLMHIEACEDGAREKPND